MPESLNRLASHLREALEEIVDRWQCLSDRDEDHEVASKLTRQEFRNNIPAAIECLCKALETDTEAHATRVMREEIAKHGHHRWKQGFNLQELVRDWGHLDQALSRTISAYYDRKSPWVPTPASERSLAFERLAEFMAIAMATSVRRYDDLRRAEAASIAHDLELARRELRELDGASEGRATLLRQAVHDLRGGLSAAASGAQVLKLRHSEPAEIVDGLVRAIASVGDLLSDLLELTRLECGGEPVELAQTDVASLLRDVVEAHGAQAASKGLSLVLDGTETLTALTDARKVRRIVQNLLVNALEHTKQGEIRLAWRVEAERWHLAIEDTGPGMQESAGSPIARELDSPDHELRRKRTGGTATYSGEGIGLTIVKRLCEALDAGISLASEQGRGTTIELDFPRNPTSPDD